MSEPPGPKTKSKMKLMSATAIVSVEDYLRRTEKPYCEYVDGVLYPKPMPTKLHVRIQYLLQVLLNKQGVEAFAELHCRISPTKYLIPDVVAAPFVQDPYPTEPVLLCIEILSPGDHIGATLAKCEEYHAWGVPYCWVIDPEKQTAWQYASGSDPEHLTRAGILTAGQLAVSLDELFSHLPL
jgi:Uma2 family endonuclease